MADYKLIDLSKKYIQKGKFDELNNYIQQHNLTQEFIQQIFQSSFQRRYEGKEYNEALDLSNFALKISIESLKEKYGETLADRFMEIMYNMTQPSQRNMCLLRLMNSPIKITTQEQSKTLEKILNIASDKDSVVGTHIIGSEIGDTLLNEGICLTGHKFVARDISKSIKQKIEKNVTLYQNDPLGVILQMIEGRRYNHPAGEFNDIMIVSIPVEELEQNEHSIIIQKDQNEYVNPAYIRGFARINVESACFENFVDNTSFIEKSKNSQSMNSGDWKKNFEMWYEKSRTTKMQKIKLGIINFFSKILNKEKTPMINDGTKKDDRGR